MNAKTCKRIRKAASYRRDGPAQYEAPEIHHLAEAPVYMTHQRTIRELGPVVPGVLPNLRARGLFHYVRRSGGVRGVVSRTVEKIIYGKDGRTPLSPLWKLVEKPGTSPDKPEKIHVPQTMLLSITKPIRLKQGSPKAIYRLLKRLERTVGLDQVYAQVAAEAGVV